MKIFSYVFVVILVFASCANIDQPKDKSSLLPGDYRLFQGTPVWLLAKAAYYKDWPSIKMILSNNPELANVQDSIYGNTMLMMAIINQDYKLFKLLIDNGANVNYHNTYGGESPLIEACSYRQYDAKFAKELVARGANINDTTNNTPQAQISPLMAAAICGNSSVVEFLIKNGADINYKNNFGTTSLGEAISTQNFDVALILLNNGADFSSPIYYAVDDYGKRTVPTNLLTALRDAMVEIGTSEYFQKREIIKFLNKRGMNYDTVPIPDYIIDRAKEIYPYRWQKYLQSY